MWTLWRRALTLKENNLEVIEKISPSAARLIANKSSFKFKTDMIENIAGHLEVKNVKNFKIQARLKTKIFSQRGSVKTNVEGIVSEIIENVKTNGDKALFEYCEKFDRAKLSSFAVSKEEIESGKIGRRKIYKHT